MKNLRNTIRLIGLLVAIIFTNQGVQAQQIPIYNQYPYNPFLYNPAMAGADGYTDLYFNYKKQWTGVPDAPDTKTLTIDAAFAKGKVGLGGQIFSDNTHILQRIGANISYAYYLKFNEERTHYLSIGIYAGFMNINLNTDEANIQDLDDQLLAAQSKYRTNLDLGLGINYHYKGLNIGFSVPQLGSLIGNSTELQFDNKNHYVGSVSYDIRLGKSKQFGLEPMALIRAQQGVEVSVYGHLKFDWDDKVWVGAGYTSVNAGANASAGFRVHEMFSVTYTYEVPVLSETNLFGHTHEFMVGFRFGNYKKKEQLVQIDQIINDVRRLKANQGSNMEELERVDSIYQQLEKKVIRNEGDIEILYEEVENLKESTNRIMMMDFLDVEDGGNVFFKQGRSNLSEDGEAQLDKVIEMIRGRDIVRLEIVGYASTEGDENSNLILSNKRCASVKDYILENSDLEYSKVLTIPNGESNPMVDDRNLPYDEREANRRVDIYILYNQDK